MPQIRDDRDDEKQRRCLRCQCMFLSIGAGNRICSDCTSKPVVQMPMQRVHCDFDSLPSEGITDDDFNR